MRTRALGWGAVLLLFAAPACQGALSVTQPGDGGDDDGGVDPWGDDDDGGVDGDTPEYTGTLDLDASTLTAECLLAADGESGEWGFRAEITGWAGGCWAELHLEDYCEGYEEDGDPCETAGVERPGWAMTQGPFGHDEEQGFWDVWGLALPFIAGWPPAGQGSTVACFDEPTLRVCCADAAETDVVECADVDAR